jgi:DNA processing protein
MEPFPVKTISSIPLLPRLDELSDIPLTISMRGSIEKMYDTIPITIIGSTYNSSYGKYVCEEIVASLESYPVTIISGLHKGIDTIAHSTAITYSIPAMAILSSGLGWDAIQNDRNNDMAQLILEHNGALISEYTNETITTPWTLSRRNRLLTLFSTIVIVIEAEDTAYALSTAELAMKYGKLVCAVPGSIYSPTSVGTHALLKNGAFPITEGKDIIELLFQYQCF